MRHKLYAAVLTLPLFSCSGNSVIPSAQEQITVDSVPVGASVRVLGEAMGQTPLTLSTNDIFPRTFAPEKQHLYGRIQLNHPGCEPYTATVSSRMISNGLKAKLKCDTAPVPSSTVTTAPPPVQPVALKQRLQQLKELFEEGLISEEDYSRKRQELLQEL